MQNTRIIFQKLKVHIKNQLGMYVKGVILGNLDAKEIMLLEKKQKGLGHCYNVVWNNAWAAFCSARFLFLATPLEQKLPFMYMSM